LGKKMQKQQKTQTGQKRQKTPTAQKPSARIWFIREPMISVCDFEKGKKAEDAAKFATPSCAARFGGPRKTPFVGASCAARQSTSQPFFPRLPAATPPAGPLFHKKQFGKPTWTTTPAII
jgi:hypothetical protein